MKNLQFNGDYVEEKPKDTYLGDGLYARDDGFMFWLRAPRPGGDHEVALENQVVDAFFRFIERSRGVKITVTQSEDAKTVEKRDG